MCCYKRLTTVNQIVASCKLSFLLGFIPYVGKNELRQKQTIVAYLLSSSLGVVLQDEVNESKEL